MKKSYLIICLLSVSLSTSYAQVGINTARQSWYKSSPSEYMWKYVGNECFSADLAFCISLAFSPASQPYVAFTDYAASGKATVMKFDGINWVYVGNAGFSLGSGEVLHTSLAFSPADSLPYVAFQDTSFSYKATVMKFNGQSWGPVGAPNFTSGGATYTSLVFSPTDSLPYVAYAAVDNGWKATVMKFDGTNWVYVGNAGFSAAQSFDISLAFSPSGEPYVAYVDYQNSWEATVMKFNGSVWSNVGMAGFSAGQIAFTSLAFSPMGDPYIAYEDYANSHKATVMKFDGTAWLNEGTAGFSAASASFTRLAFSPAGQPYVVFEDWANLAKATVMKFDGTNWIVMGNAGFSMDRADFTCLAFSPSGQPYVAYTDYADAGKATVMQYDSVYAGVEEPRYSLINLFPNPATDKITIERPAKDEKGRLTILNVEGQELITRQLLEPKMEINTHTLPVGIYFVRITNDRTVEMGKFIKQ